MIIKGNYILEKVKKACEEKHYNFNDQQLKDSYVIFDKGDMIYLLLVDRISKNIIDLCLYRLNSKLIIYPIVDVFSTLAKDYIKGEFKYITVTLLNDDLRIKNQCSYFYSKIGAKMNTIQIDGKPHTQYVIDCKKMLDEGLYRNEKFFSKEIIQEFDSLRK